MPLNRFSRPRHPSGQYIEAIPENIDTAAGVVGVSGLGNLGVAGLSGHGGALAGPWMVLLDRLVVLVLRMFQRKTSFFKVAWEQC